jgi:hypothetical protein
MSNPFSDFEHQIQEEKNQIKVLKAEIERLTRELREEREAFMSRQLHDTKLIQELRDAAK